MRLTTTKLVLATVAAACLAATPAQAAIRITEWMYNGLGDGGAGEYIEVTNTGAAPVDMTGWSFDDNGRTAGAQSLSAFGTLAPGESAILAEMAAADFRAEWGLGAAVKVIGGNSNNLGRSDEINIYDASSVLVDRLTYGDQDFAGTIRTLNIAGNPGTPAALGANNVALWILSTVGDSFGSTMNTSGDIGNPGVYGVAIPEPATVAMAGAALIAGGGRRRKT